MGGSPHDHDEEPNLVHQLTYHDVVIPSRNRNAPLGPSVLVHPYDHVMRPRDYDEGPAVMLDIQKY